MSESFSARGVYIRCIGRHQGLYKVHTLHMEAWRVGLWWGNSTHLRGAKGSGVWRVCLASKACPSKTTRNLNPNPQIIPQS